MERIGVIIPVVNVRLAIHLLDCIAANTVKPDNLLVINNSEYFSSQLSNTVNKHCSGSGWSVCNPHKPMPVNDSWKLGFKLLGNCCELISVLNDDLIIESRFFEKIALAAAQDDLCGVFCPETIKDVSQVFNAPKMAISTPMVHREGWAFTIRKNLLNKIPPIPSELKTFYGDDWLWHFTYANGMTWKKLMGCQVYHYGSVSVDRLIDFKETYYRERKIFRDCILGSGVKI